MQTLLAEFVAAADEVGRLQRGGNAEGDLFRGFCEQGHYGGRTQPTATRQGIYAVTPSGRFLASINTTSPERMAGMLREALAKWRDLPAAERLLDDDARQRLEQVQRFEQRYPEDGLVLAEYMRDLDVAADDRDWKTHAWNEDQVWFTAAEAASLVPKQAEAGARAEVPEPLVTRLVRLHLVDSVRGQTPSLPREAVVEAALSSEVVRVSGEQVELRLAGRTRTEQKGRWTVADQGQPVDHARGIETRLDGRAVWDNGTRRFVSFELLAIGHRFGATQYNGRPTDGEPTAIGFAFVLAAPDHPRVAPAFWWEYGWR